MTPHLRWLIRRDMPEVLDIERVSFANPWNEAEFIGALRHRNVVAKVATESKSVWAPILGYMFYELHHNRLELLNLAVTPVYRRQGIGAAMIDNLAGKLTLQRRRALSTVVGDDNLGAHLFLAAQGFIAQGVLRGAYEATDQDAYLFTYRVAAPALEAVG